MTTPIGSVRDVTPNRSIQLGGTIPGSCSFHTIGGADADVSPFYPVPGGFHSRTTAYAAGRTWTITDAAVALPYDLKTGEGFIFWVQNESGNTITLAGAGSVTADANVTLTAANNNTTLFALIRTSATAHVLTRFGTLTH